MKVTSLHPQLPDVQVWSTKGLVILQSSVIVVVETKVGPLTLAAPAGMVCDGASVPGVLWGVLDAGPLQLLTMGILHDASYRTDSAWIDALGQNQTILRESADDLAEAVARYHGASWLDGRKIRYGLGIGGRSSFHKKSLLWSPA
jgi:hypothetical protein